MFSLDQGGLRIEMHYCCAWARMGEFDVVLDQGIQEVIKIRLGTQKWKKFFFLFF